MFWSLNPRTLAPFIEAFKQKQMLYRDQTNFAAWLSGIYFSKAIAANLSKGAKYFDKPIELNESKQNNVGALEKFEAISTVFNSRFEKNK